MAVWEQDTETYVAIGASALDAAGPRLEGLGIPATGAPGEALEFSVAPLDVWSGVADPVWSFGDGTSTTGSQASHTYATAGDYPVQVTASDTLGNATTATGTVSIRGASSPPPSPPPAPPVPQPTAPPGAAPPGVAAGSPVQIGDRVASVKGAGAVRVKLACLPGTLEGCAGRLTLRTARPVSLGAGRRRTITLGSDRFSISAGTTGRVSVRLSPTGRRLLRRLGTLTVNVLVTAPDDSGGTVTATRTIALKGRR